MLTIDIHTHILPREWPNLKEKYGYGGWIHLDHHKCGCARMMKDQQFFREIDKVNKGIFFSDILLLFNFKIE